MRILVTRSGPEAAVLVARLRSLGLVVCHYAPFRLEAPPDPAHVQRELLSGLPADFLLVPSTEALRQLAHLVGSADLGDTRIVVPGRGSAACARELGFLNVVFPAAEGTSERMLGLPELAEVEGKRVLILAAEGGRRLVEQSLRRRGAEVRRLHVYRRVPVEPGADVLEAVAAGRWLVTLLASGGALSGLREGLPEDVWRKLCCNPVVAPSVRVADLAAAAGCGQVTTACGADDDSMLAALFQACPELRAMRYSFERGDDESEP